LLRTYERDLKAIEAWKRDTYPSIAARIAVCRNLFLG
jgi:hypothetical protein